MVDLSDWRDLSSDEAAPQASLQSRPPRYHHALEFLHCHSKRSRELGQELGAAQERSALVVISGIPVLPCASAPPPCRQASLTTSALPVDEAIAGNLLVEYAYALVCVVSNIVDDWEQLPDKLALELLRECERYIKTSSEAFGLARDIFVGHGPEGDEGSNPLIKFRDYYQKGRGVEKEVQVAYNKLARRRGE